MSNTTRNTTFFTSVEAEEDMEYDSYSESESDDEPRNGEPREGEPSDDDEGQTTTGTTAALPFGGTATPGTTSEPFGRPTVTSLPLLMQYEVHESKEISQPRLLDFSNMHLLSNIGNVSARDIFATLPEYKVSMQAVRAIGTKHLTGVLNSRAVSKTRAAVDHAIEQLHKAMISFQSAAADHDRALFRQAAAETLDEHRKMRSTSKLAKELKTQDDAEEVEEELAFADQEAVDLINSLSLKRQKDAAVRLFPGVKPDVAFNKLQAAIAKH